MTFIFSVYRENLPQPIHSKLFEKLKIFFQFFAAFLKLTFIFTHVKQKYESHSICLSKIVDVQIRRYVNV